MPWKKPESPMELKTEFVKMAAKPNRNMSQLCRRYGISRKTGYKWLARYRAEGLAGLAERSRRPHSSPNKTPKAIEQLVIQARQNDPGWGGRKLRRHLINRAQEGAIATAPEKIPSASTITAILERCGLLEPAQSPARQGPWQHFERDTPNELWQMDFKGEFRLSNGDWCYPLTIIDDHSRFSLAVAACADQKRRTVQPQLRAIFTRYGLPAQILCDNGAPWGSSVRFADGRPHYTKLAAWMIRLGINVCYSRPGHPQSKGKNERFNGTLQAELLRFERFADYAEANQQMAQWRKRYNTIRPHQALHMARPADHYQLSSVKFPSPLPPVAYGPDDPTRKVSAKGQISFRGDTYRVGKAFEGYRVAVRTGTHPDEHKIYFCNQHIRTINLTQNHN